jgi:hypothetical protein
MTNEQKTMLSDLKSELEDYYYNTKPLTLWVLLDAMVALCNILLSEEK